MTVSRRLIGRLMPLVVLLAATTWACQTESDQPADMETPNPADSGDNPTDGPDLATAEVHDANLDAPCQPVVAHADQMEYPVEGFHVSLVFNGYRALRVLVTACDAVVPNATVQFEEVEDERGICALESSNVVTGADGVAVATVTSPQESQAGDCKFNACLGDKCVVFHVRVFCKCLVPLVVGFGAYSGADPMANTGMVYLYLQDGSNRPNCADLPPDEWAVVPTETKGPLSILTTVQFPALPDLDVGKSLVQDYTVRCTAGRESGPSFAYGCQDDVRVELGARTYVECPLVDLPAK